MDLLWAENVKLHAEVSVLRGVTAKMAEEFAPPPQPSDRAPQEVSGSAQTASSDLLTSLTERERAAAKRLEGADSGGGPLGWR